MATLTGRAPKDTYGDLMQVSNGNSGVDGTLRFLSDGKGGNSTLKLSSSTAQFTTTLLSTGLLTTTAGITSGSNIISDTDSTDSLGSTSVRWLKLWVDNITMGGAFAGATGTFSSTLAVTGLTTIASLKGTGAVTITDILDEDNMASDSATKLATQQSIKAYVDAQVDTADTLAEILAIGNTTGGTDVSVSTDDKVQFRDAAIYINSSADGQLDIVADTEIQIATTTVDLNGNLDVSGTALVTGVLTATATSVHTGGITSGGDIISDTDSTDSLGSNLVRWLKGWYDTLQAGTLVMGAGSITDTSGAISFGNENLTTTGIVTAAGTSVFTNLDISGDIDVDGTSNLDIVDIDGAVDMASTLAVAGVVTANAGVVVDNITIDGTQIDLSSGDLTLDVAGDIILDASGGNIIFNHNGTEILDIQKDGNNAEIRSRVSDGDILFRGVDGGAAVTALTLDMSAAGAATFNAGLTSTGDITSGTDVIAGSDLVSGDTIVWTGDTNTYFDHPSADTIRVVTGGSVAATFNSSQGLVVAGALSKGSGSFRIPHPLPSLNETHELVYSFTESPQADLIHRGKVALVNGVAEVNIDVASKTTEGTFVLLCGDVQCFTTNETDWCPIRGSVSGNILTIVAQDNTCTDTISWMVIGERKDQHMIDTDWTDDEGHVINEPLKPVEDNEE